MTLNDAVCVIKRVENWIDEMDESLLFAVPNVCKELKTDWDDATKVSKADEMVNAIEALRHYESIDPACSVAFFEEHKDDKLAELSAENLQEMGFEDDFDDVYENPAQYLDYVKAFNKDLLESTSAYLVYLWDNPNEEI